MIDPKHILLGMIALLTTCWAAASHADVMTLRSEWDDALAAMGYKSVIETLDDPIANDISITLPNGIVSEGFGGSTDNLVSGGSYHGRVDTDDDSTAVVFNHIVWTLPEPVIAFAADFAAADTAEELIIRIDLDGTGPADFNVGDTLGTGSGFIGFIGDVPFETVTFISNVSSAAIAPDEAFGVDNVSLPIESQIIPEPGSLLLLLVGLVLPMAGRGRRCI